MRETFEITAEPRTEAGTGASRRLRRMGRVPAIIYGGGREPEPVSLHQNTLLQHLEHEAFYSHILNLRVGDAVTRVVLKDLQRHPAKSMILHLDFQRVIEGEEIRMTVPIHLVNESKSKGVKAGGVISRTLTEIEVSCLPDALPEFIEIDMREMGIGDILHLSEVTLPEGVRLAHVPDPDVPVVIIHGAHADETPGAGGGEASGPE